MQAQHLAPATDIARPERQPDQRLLLRRARLMHLPLPGGAAPGDVAAGDRRRFRRVGLPLGGRLLDPCGEEHAFELLNVSPGGMALRSAARWQVGARAVIYCNGLGRLVAEIVRGDGGTFAVRFDLSPHKRERLADEITWLWNRDRLGLADERSFTRAQADGRVSVSLDDGRMLTCDVVDMSLFGVLLACTQDRPLIGQEAILAGRRCRVARYTDAGFALDFRNGLAPGGEV